MTAPTEIVAMDVGGTNARFCVATLAVGEAPSLGPVFRVAAAEHPTFGAAWGEFARWLGRLPPRAATLAVACPVDGDVLKLTNSPWSLRRSALPAELGVDRLAVLNDFGAVTHAVPWLEAAGGLVHLCGPDTGLPDEGAISVIGPGTGLGVGLLLRRGGVDHVIETEAGHADFAAVDPIEDALLERLRARYTRVSVERVVSGPGLVNIYETLAAAEGRAVKILDDKALWPIAIAGEDALAADALERFAQALGSAVGNIALTHLARAVVLAGGIPPRIVAQLRGGGFAARMRAKGRFEHLLAKVPVFVCTHPEPGLLGAAAAFGVMEGFS